MLDDEEERLPRKKRGDYSAYIAFGVVGIVFGIGAIVVIAAARREPDGKGAVAAKGAPKDAPKAAGGLVDIQIISQDYRTNIVTADSKWTGKQVTCEATMHKLEKHNSGGYVMSTEAFMDGFNLTKSDVYAYFPATEADKLAKFEYRSTVYFTGRCEGIVPGVGIRVVAIRECRVITPPNGK